MSDSTPQSAPQVPDDSQRDERAALAQSRVADVFASTSPGTKKSSIPIGSSYANYLFGSAGSGDKPAWSDTAKGRAMIRLVSRGLIGSAFFTIGGRFARSQLRNYHAEGALPENAPLLQRLARGLDNTLGRGIKGIAWLAADTSTAVNAEERLLLRRTAALDAVDFRPKSYYHDTPEIANIVHRFRDGMTISRPPNGRSYGAEVVGVTFDFAMASIGDASARNVIQAFDPNVKHSWMRDENDQPTTRGKGHFDFGRWLKAVGTSSWRIMTKNQGEDWATGLVYVFQMKYQRQMLNNWFKGAKLVFDNHWNGGAYKVDDAGRIIGDYQLPGAIDLHARFVGYNWYTLMYREAYDAVGEHLKKWKDGTGSLLPHLSTNPIRDTIDGVANSVRYVAKSFIKANLYMQPAVIPFWLFRVPQSKWRGAYIAQNQPGNVNAIGLKRPDTFAGHAQQEAISRDYNFPYNTGANKYPTAQGINLRDGSEPNTLFVGNRAIHDAQAIRVDPFSVASYEHYKTGTGREQFEKGFSQALNPFGWVSYKLGSLATRATRGLSKRGIGRVMGWDGADPTSSFRNPTDLGHEVFMRSYVDAAVAYTPYMWAKAEAALRVDEHKPNERGPIDNAIYNLIDNTVALNLRGVITTARDVIKLGLHYDRDVKSREGTPLPEKPSAPTNTVARDTIQHSGNMRAANNNHPDADNDNPSNERNWAETVAGRHLGATFQAPGSTRH
ncbi:MAG: hypothetical protein ACKVOE_09330 [Rickettsiales bacterium]